MTSSDSARPAPTPRLAALRRLGRLAAALGIGLSVAPPASAEDPARTFSFDTLLVAPIQAIPPQAAAPPGATAAPDLVADAAALTERLAAKLAETVQTMPISEVPAFEAQGYGADVYVLSCPSGEYTGCALVVGQRGEADWVVGGTLSAVDDELVGGGRQLVLQVHFVDVGSMREVLAFGVVVPADDPAGQEPILDQLSMVFDRIIDGAFDEIDIRGDLEDPEVRAQLERAREQAIAGSLDALEASIGDIERGVPLRDIAPPRISKEDLVGLADREDGAPWERLGLTQGQYVRFKNSGESLEDWRRTLRGRFGQVLIRGGLTTGGGPWGVRHEGQYLQEFDAATSTFQTVSVVQWQGAERASSTGFDLELDLGVAPFLEVGFALTGRASRVRYRFDQELVGEPSTTVPESGTTVSTLGYGPRVAVAPFPEWPARPLLGAGVSFWDARGVPPPADMVDKFVPLAAPSLVLLQLLPGIEVNAGRYLFLYARGAFELPLSGATIDRYEVAPERLPDAPAPTGDPGIGLGVQLGVQVRLSVLRPRKSTGPAQFEDQDEL